MKILILTLSFWFVSGCAMLSEVQQSKEIAQICAVAPVIWQAAASPTKAELVAMIDGLNAYRELDDQINKDVVLEHYRTSLSILSSAMIMTCASGHPT